MKKIEQNYLSTSKMAKMIDINERWLRANRGAIFQEGIHYHFPLGFNDCRWNVSAMLNWVENSSNVVSDVTNEILNSICA